MPAPAQKMRSLLWETYAQNSSCRSIALRLPREPIWLVFTKGYRDAGAGPGDHRGGPLERKAPGSNAGHVGTACFTERLAFQSFGCRNDGSQDEGAEGMTIGI